MAGTKTKTKTKPKLTANENEPVTLTTNQRKAFVNDLINNTEEWNEDSRSLLEKMSDEQLNSITVNAYEVSLLNNEDEEEDDDLEDDLEDDDEAQDQGDEDDGDEEEDPPITANRRRVTNNGGGMKKMKKKKKGVSMDDAMTCNSVEEFIEAAPDGLQGPLADMYESAIHEKRNLIKKLVANSNCPYDKNELAAKQNSELRKLAKLAGIQVAPQRQPVFAGANGFDFTANEAEEFEQEALVAPTAEAFLPPAAKA